MRYASRTLEVPAWPGTEHRGSWYQRKDRITGRGSIGYGRASHNAKQAQGIQDSADEQADQYSEWCAEMGTSDLGVLLDPSASAGITAAKEREYFAKALEMIRTDSRVSVLWVMHSSRMSRGDISFDDLMAIYIECGILIAAGDDLFNPANLEDREALFQKFAADRGATVGPRVASRDGQRKAIREGRPMSTPAYGLRRDRNQVPAMDVPDDRAPDGQPATDTMPAVVRELFKRIAAGDTSSMIARDMEARGVLMPKAAKGYKPRKLGFSRDAGRAEDGRFMWQSQCVESIIRNPTYIGKRTGADGTLCDVRAVPLVSETLWREANAHLDARRRTRARYSPRNLMLTGIAVCGVCGTPLQFKSSGRRKKDGVLGRFYGCGVRGHVAIEVGRLDGYVSRAVVAWLASPQVKAELSARHEEDAADAIAAETEVLRLSKLITELGEEIDNPPAGADKEDLADARRQRRGLRQQLADARKLAAPSSLDPLLMHALGPGAGERWGGYSPVIRRKLIAMIARITVRPVGRGHGSLNVLPLSALRVGWEWKQRNPVTGSPVAGSSAVAALVDGQEGPCPYSTAVERLTLRMVEWLATQDTPCTARQVADALDLPKTTTHRALYAAVKDGLVGRGDRVAGGAYLPADNRYGKPAARFYPLTSGEWPASARTPLSRAESESFTCPRCGAASWNPADIREGYCGRCHDWTGAPSPHPPKGARARP